MVKIFPTDDPIQTSSPDLSPRSSRKNSDGKPRKADIKFDVNPTSSSTSGGPNGHSKVRDLHISHIADKRVGNSHIPPPRTSDTERKHMLELPPPSTKGAGKSVTFEKVQSLSSPQFGGSFNFHPTIMTSLKPKLVRVNKNFSLVTHEELTHSYGLNGFRLKLALFLRQRLYDITSLIVISLYSLLIFLYLAFEEYLFPKE